MKSPEQILKAFLKAWKNSNKKQMHLNTTKTWQSSHTKSDFQGKELKDFEIISMTPSLNKMDFRIKLNGDLMTVRLVLESAPYEGGDKSNIEECKKFNISSSPSWGVNPISFRPIK